MKIRERVYRSLCFFLSFWVLSSLTGLVFATAKAENTAHPVAETGNKMASIGSFANYTKQYPSLSPATDEILLTDVDVTDKGTETVIKFYEDLPGKAVAIDPRGYATWSFSVEQEAFYAVEVIYKVLPYQDNGATVTVMLDDTLPYQELKSLSFRRIWKDEHYEGGFRKDNLGNDITPESIDTGMWQSMTLGDVSGLYSTPFLLALESGDHTLTLTMEKETIAVASLRLYSYKPAKNYAQALAEYETAGYTPADAEPILIEAEYPSAKSDFTITPIYDRSSPLTSPQTMDSIRLNTIGGSRWVTEGQWIEWKLDVPEDGLYKIAVRYRQNIVEGLFSSRILTIDNELPFQEAANLRFPFSESWQSGFLGDGEHAYLFYLEAGERTLRLTCTLGDTAKIVEELDNCVLELNAVYREILAVTGPTPDNYRDYDFPTIIPETFTRMDVLADRLEALVEQVQTLNGVKGELISVAARTSELLRQLIKKPTRIAKSFSQLKDSAGSLGSAVQSMRQQPLELDLLALTPTEQPLVGDAGFFRNFWNQIRLFVTSFTSDYSLMGNAGGDKPTIKVWVATGRDQTTIINDLIYSRMDPDKPYEVSLELVSSGALLPATLAGIGPDVSISNALNDPINFAIRDGVLNLTQFEDCSEVTSRFAPSALVPLSYNGALYALPETQSFPMLFYREDILQEKGLSIPETWDDLISLIPELSNDHMEFGFLQGTEGLLPLMVQLGIPLYRENGLYTNLDSDGALGCFKQLCDFYTLYKLPISYDFVNRFRTGEMPIAVADFTAYNQLTVFAPEINGLWRMAMVPGTVRDDGTVSHAVNTTGLACMILHGTKYAEYAWDFLKWWTGTDIQKNYALNMESILGVAAKQPVANLDAFNTLSWESVTFESLAAQRNYTVGIPEVPGGYIVSRNIAFAFNKVVGSNTKPTDTLLDYIDPINTELKRKQREFGLIS